MLKSLSAKNREVRAVWRITINLGHKRNPSSDKTFLGKQNHDICTVSYAIHNQGIANQMSISVEKSDSRFQKRNITLDVLRTLAIVLMVVFHFMYDLKFFGWVQWAVPDGAGWKQFRYLILSLFFISLGISMVMAHSARIKWRAFSIRIMQIALGAGAITLLTLFMVPKHWIYFGVLHFIIVASLLALAFVSRPKLALCTGLTLIILFNLGVLNSVWPFASIKHLLPSYSNDYVGVFPWIGVVLIGIWLGHTESLKNDPLKGVIKKDSWLNVPGQHSLIIYLVHQPIFFALMGLVSVII
tara:strand:+ start:43 stop:939 length:897 start_codon:yes stop_codon:yes gene_type:complete